jgi:hypothetical protein
MTSLRLPENTTSLRLDALAPFRMDRRAHPAPAAHAKRGGSANAPWSHPGRDVERTSNPCPPYQHSTRADSRALCPLATALPEAGRR